MKECKISALLLNSTLYLQRNNLLYGGGISMDWKKIGFGASLVSIVGSIGIYFAHDENLGIFVGLWASALILLTDRLSEMQAAN